jgi:hypothetical protein
MLHCGLKSRGVDSWHGLYAFQVYYGCAFSDCEANKRISRLTVMDWPLDNFAVKVEGQCLLIRQSQ